MTERPAADEPEEHPPSTRGSEGEREAEEQDEVPFLDGDDEPTAG